MAHPPNQPPPNQRPHNQPPQVPPPPPRSAGAGGWPPPGGYGGPRVPPGGYAAPAPGGGPPRGGGRRRGVLIAVVAVVAVALIAGGVFAVLQLTGGSDEVAASSPEPGSTGEPDPSEGKADDQAGHEPEADEVTPITTALAAGGYACYPSLMETVDIGGKEPVMVHSCYLDPASHALDEQVVRIQSGEDGTIRGVTVRVRYSPYINGIQEEDRSGEAGQAFGDTLAALEGPLLANGDAAVIVDGQDDDESPDSPALHSTQNLPWGASHLTVSEDRMSYTLDLEAEDGSLVAIPAGDTGATISETETLYSGKGYACEVETDLKVLTCRRERPGALYTVQVFDSCLNSAEKYDLICEGRAANRVSNSVAFGDLSDAGFQELGGFLMDGTGFAMGGWEPEARAWALDSFGATQPAVRHADFQGMHLSYEPGVSVPGGGPNSDYPNGVQFTVQGHNLS